MAPQNKDAKLRQHGWLMPTIFAVFLVGLFLLFDLSGLGGNIRFYSKWIECGQKPVGIDLQGTVEGDVGYYGEPPTFKLIRLSPTYFCTAFDAEKHGYSAKRESYEFPVLEKAGALCRKPNEPKSETAAQFSQCSES